MLYPSNTLKIKSIDTENGVAIVHFANTLTYRKMIIVSYDLFGGFSMKYADKTRDPESHTYSVSEQTTNKWLEYTVEDEPEVEEVQRENVGGLEVAA